MRSLQLAGKSLDALLANPIKAKLGTSVYPYKKYGPYYDYDAENPYLIYKDSTPHLYLTKSSGIELTGEFSSSANRGLALPVNKIKRENYYVSSLEFSMRFTRDDLVQEPVQILEILDGSNSNEIKLWLEPSLPADQRFRLFATDQDDNELTDVALYLNGKEVTNTLISKNDWNMIGVAFDTPLDISERSGSINFVGPVIVNNISYFALNSTQQAKLNILSSPEYVGIDMSLAYAILTGTNKTIVNDGYSIYPENYRYSFITGINGQSATIKPV